MGQSAAHLPTPVPLCCCSEEDLSSVGAGKDGRPVPFTPAGRQQLKDEALLEAISNNDMNAAATAVENGARLGPSSRVLESQPASASNTPVDHTRVFGPPLLLAARNADEDLVRMLLEHAAHIEAQDRDGWSALFFASQRGHLGICSLLLEYRADPIRNDRSGLNALDYAKDLEIRQALEEMLRARNIPQPRLKTLGPPPGANTLPINRLQTQQMVQMNPSLVASSIANLEKLESQAFHMKNESHSVQQYTEALQKHKEAQIRCD